MGRIDVGGISKRERGKPMDEWRDFKRCPKCGGDCVKHDWIRGSLFMTCRSCVGEDPGKGSIELPDDARFVKMTIETGETNA